MEEIENLVKLYEARRFEAESFAAQIVTMFQSAPTLKVSGQIPIVHSLKSRTKDPDHLRDKLQRKIAKGRQITVDNLFSEITDFAGVRVLHLYNSQFEAIHNLIMEQVNRGNYVLNEDPVANTWDPETSKNFERLGLKTEVRDTYYTSVHYVLRPNSNPNSICCEVQVRTLFEEIWGEIDHVINYPHPTESIACREELRVLAKLVSTGTRLVDGIINSFEEFKNIINDDSIKETMTS